MSNQVYENNQNQYYNQNGLNLYQADQLGILYNVANTYSWTEQIIQSPGIVDIIEDPMKFIALKNGVYNFSFTFQMQETTSPSTVDLEPSISVLCVKDIIGTTALANYEIRIPAKGVGTGEDSRLIPMSCCVYLNKGEYVYASITSKGGTGLNIEYTSCTVVMI